MNSSTNKVTNKGTSIQKPISSVTPMANIPTATANNVTPPANQITESSPVVDLDKEIPNYANNIAKSASQRAYEIQKAAENVKNMVGNYLTSKWNETKLNMQKMSIGKTSNEQTGGKRRKHKQKNDPLSIEKPVREN